jgi:hypothetical protein
VAHPFADSTVGFTFTVANVGWDAVRDDLGHTIGISNHGDDKLVGLGFLRVNSTNSDACHSYGTFNDEPLGPTVDDLVTSLESMYYFGSPDLASVQEPVSGSFLGGYSGRFLRIKMPDRSFEDCDDGGYRIWNADGFDIYAQGPLNRWDLDILDVDGERIVVLVSDFETTAGALRDELRRIRSSITITP